MYWQDQRYTPHTVSVSACHMYIRSRPLSQVVLGVGSKTGNARLAICLIGVCLFAFGIWSKIKQHRGLLTLNKYHRGAVGQQEVFFLSFRYTLRVTLSITLHMKIGLISAGVWFHLECTETFSSFFLSKEFLIQ